MPLSDHRRSPRDENGWRVPREGTLSRRVYDMIRAETPRHVMLRELAPIKRHTINKLVWRMRHPDMAAASARTAYHRRTKVMAPTIKPDATIRTRTRQIGRSHLPKLKPTDLRLYLGGPPERLCWNMDGNRILTHCACGTQTSHSVEAAVNGENFSFKCTVCEVKNTCMLSDRVGAKG